MTMFYFQLADQRYQVLDLHNPQCRELVFQLLRGLSDEEKRLATGWALAEGFQLRFPSVTSSEDPGPPSPSSSISSEYPRPSSPSPRSGATSRVGRGRATQSVPERRKKRRQSAISPKESPRKKICPETRAELLKILGAAPSWEEDPRKLFEQEATYAVHPHRCTATDLYRNICGLQQRSILDRIRRRFYLMGVYSVAELVKQHRTRRVDDEIIKGIVESGATSENAEHVADSWRRWTYWGHKYHNLSRDLGGKGVIFLISDDVFSSNFLERKMALQGPGFDSVCEELARLGLPQEAQRTGLNQVADRIWNWIWDGLQQNLAKTYPLGPQAETSTISTQPT